MMKNEMIQNKVTRTAEIRKYRNCLTLCTRTVKLQTVAPFMVIYRRPAGEDIAPAVWRFDNVAAARAKFETVCSGLN